LIWYYNASEFNSLYTSFFGGKNIVHITLRVNLIHSKLVFFFKCTKNKTLKKNNKKIKTIHANSAIHSWTVGVNCTVHWNTVWRKTIRSCFGKIVFQTWIIMGPTKINCVFLRNQTFILLWLLQTQKQLRKQTTSI
jgi:hypothetical protein